MRFVAILAISLSINACKARQPDAAKVLDEESSGGGAPLSVVSVAESAHDALALMELVYKAEAPGQVSIADNLKFYAKQLEDRVRTNAGDFQIGNSAQALVLFYGNMIGTLQTQASTSRLRVATRRMTCDAVRRVSQQWNQQLSNQSDCSQGGSAAGALGIAENAADSLTLMKLVYDAEDPGQASIADNLKFHAKQLEDRVRTNAGDFLIGNAAQAVVLFYGNMIGTLQTQATTSRLRMATRHMTCNAVRKVSQQWNQQLNNLSDCN